VRVDVFVYRLYVYDRCHAQASRRKSSGSIARRDLLLHVEQLSDAVERCQGLRPFPPRQAYRYLEQAQRLKTAGPANRSQTGIHCQTSTEPGSARAHVCCGQGLSIRRGCQRALLALLPRGRGLGEPKPIRQRALQLEYRFDRLLPDKLTHVYQLLVPDSASQSDAILRKSPIQRQE